jgi:hypothetical protein
LATMEPNVLVIPFSSTAGTPMVYLRKIKFLYTTLP